MIELRGKQISDNILNYIKSEIIKYDRPPRIDIFLIGDDFASIKYVDIKKTKGEEVGINVIVHKFDNSTPEELIINEINKCSKDSLCDGIMVQLPLSSLYNTDNILKSIPKEKDVDGLNNSRFLPATVRAIKEILVRYNIRIAGIKCVVLGESVEVGIPVAKLLQEMGGIVVSCNEKTKDISIYTKEADLIISATGVCGLVTKDIVKEGVICIDVGFGQKDGKIMGDIDDSVREKASAISPVPGGVGPVTVSCLLLNTLDSYKENV